MRYLVPNVSNYYHFMTEVALGLYRLLHATGQRDNKDIHLWYSGPYREIVQCFSCHPVQEMQEAPVDAALLAFERLKTKQAFRPLIGLRDFLANTIPTAVEEPGITVVKRTGVREYAEHEALILQLQDFALPVRVAAFETMSFAEQVNAARNTRVLIVPHGAAYVNMMFMPKGSTVIELNPKGYANWHVAAFAELFARHYVDLESDQPGVMGVKPNQRVAEYLSAHGWPDRKTVESWRPARLEIERVVRDVASFSLPPARIVEQVAKRLKAA